MPGGMSMPILPAGELDVPMADEFLRARKAPRSAPAASW